MRAYRHVFGDRPRETKKNPKHSQPKNVVRTRSAESAKVANNKNRKMILLNFVKF